jgi:plastocyanin
MKLLPRAACWSLFLLTIFGSFAGSQAATTNVVKIIELGTKFLFSPTNITINTGDTIKWTNSVSIRTHDSTHNPTTGPVLWQSPFLSTTPPTNTFTFTFNNAGSYPYFCREHFLTHSEQTGTVSVVTPINLPPSANLFEPANGASFFAPASFTLKANASDPDGSVTQVEFFSGNTSLGISAFPYSNNVVGLPAGSYAFTAVATDNQGAKGTSSVVNVTVSAPSSIVLSLEARLADGTFHFRISGGSAGQTAVVESAGALGNSPNSTNWTPISTNTFPNTTCPACPFIDFTDTKTNLTQRFYRSRLLP